MGRLEHPLQSCFEQMFQANHVGVTVCMDEGFDEVYLRVARGDDRR